MLQRYKVFFNDCLLSICTPDQMPPGADYERIDSPDQQSINELISRFEASERHTYFVCSNHPDVVFNVLSRSYQLIEAAGGIVRHFSGKYLFIKRFGKWDLPKGKIEHGESPEIAAIREVGEECGINELRILHELPATYHTYKLSGNKIMKKTWWFSMETNGRLETVPQIEEGITHASWLVPSQFDLVLENTYRSIAELIGEVSWNT